MCSYRPICEPCCVSSWAQSLRQIIIVIAYLLIQISNPRWMKDKLTKSTCLITVNAIRKDMDKDNASASQQIKQHHNQTQQAEKFTTKHTYFRWLTDEFFSVVFRLTVNFFGGFMATLQNSASRLNSCYVLPLCVTTLCIAIAFCIWVHEMRIQASSAERDSLLPCPYTVHRHCVGNWSQN